MNPRTTSLMETGRIDTGDVIELVLDGEPTSALVLLASDDTLILDRCDDSTPVVLRLDEIEGLKVFRPELLAAA
jgi:hypothetical protein